MGQEPNLLFPYLLDILSTQPKFSETQDNILKILKQNLKSDGVKVHNLKKEMETTLDVGKGLGILSVQGDIIRMPSIQQGDDFVELTPTEKTHSSRSRSSSRRVRRGSNKNMNRARSHRRQSRSRSRRRSHSRRSRSRRSRSRRSRSRRHSKRS